MTAATDLKIAMLREGVSMKRLAAELGVSRVFLSYVIHGHKRSSRVVARLRERFGAEACRHLEAPKVYRGEPPGRKRGDSR